MDSFDLSEQAASQAREIAEASQRIFTAAVEKRIQQLSISRELAEYLVGLEMRISALEHKR